MGYHLPRGIAVLLINAVGLNVIFTSDRLTPEEQRAARIIAYTKALTCGAAAVIVKVTDVVRIMDRAA